MTVTYVYYHFSNTVYLPSWLEVDMAISADEELGEEESLDIDVFSLNPLPFSTASLSLFNKKVLEHPPWLDLYPSSDTSELLSHKNASLPLVDIDAVEDTLTEWSQLDLEERGAPDFEATPLCNIGIALLEDFCNCWILEELSEKFLQPPWLLVCRDVDFDICEINTYS